MKSYFFNTDYIFTDAKLEEIRENIRLNEEDLLTLSLIPLMHSKKNKTDIAIDCIEVAENLEIEKHDHSALTLLYALVDKFGDKESKKKLWEVKLLS